jgi:uncharacterized protein (UPF0333 family)
VTRTSTILTIALVASLITPVVVKATGTTTEATAIVQEAKAETAAAAETPACARRVKVVYAGYGEANGNACAVTADLRR